MYRALNEIEKLGLVEELAGKYQLTVYGRLVFEQYERFNNSVEDIHRASDFLPAFSAEEGPDFKAIKDAVIIKPTNQQPDRPIRVLEQKVTQGDTVKGIISTALILNIISTCPNLSEKQVSFLVDNQILQHFRRRQAEKYARIQDSSSIEIREVSEQMTYGLVLLGGNSPEVLFIFYNEDGGLKGIISNDSEPALDWFRGKYGTYDTEYTL